jgi:hypothetical protein
MEWMGGMPKVDAHHPDDICHMPSSKVYNDKMDGMDGWNARSGCASSI